MGFVHIAQKRALKIYIILYIFFAKNTCILCLYVVQYICNKLVKQTTIQTNYTAHLQFNNTKLFIYALVF